VLLAPVIAEAAAAYAETGAIRGAAEPFGPDRAGLTAQG
jgi:hypothetical protein